MPSLRRWAARAARLSADTHTAWVRSASAGVSALTRATASATRAALACAYAARGKAPMRAARRSTVGSELIGGKQLVDDAEPQRLAGRIERRAEHQLAGARVRQPQAHDLERHARIRGTDSHLVEADPIVAIETESVVAGERHDQAAGDGMAVHHGQRRLGELEQREVRVAIEGAHARGRRRIARRRRQVEAGAEERADAGEHDGADRGVVARRFDRGEQIAEQRLVNGVGGRTVEGEQTHATVMVGGHHSAHSRHLTLLGRGRLARCLAIAARDLGQ